MPKTPWTKEEEALFPSLTNHQIADRTGRTLGSVQNKRQWLRVPSPRGKTLVEVFAEEEKTKPPIRRLFWDIETSPNVCFSWRIGRKVALNPECILKERAIICIGWKWGGEDKTHSLVWDKNQDDRAMLEKFLPVVAEADELVGHNGDRYDLPWLRTRCIFHRLPCFPDLKSVDTLQWAKRLFSFNSNKLDYLAQFLGYGGKLHTSYDLWKNICVNKDATALKTMVDYCEHDVRLLEWVYDRLAVVSPVHTHAGVLAGGAKWTCPSCGSKTVRLSKFRVTGRGTKSYQMRCGCGRYFTLAEPAYKAFTQAGT